MEEELLKLYNLKIISFSDQGSRATNEDRVYYSKLNQDGFLFMVADGMGGYEQGELAAETAIKVIAEGIIKDNSMPIIEKIELAFLKAHAAINKMLVDSGTTIGGIIILQNDIYVFWAGDVKILLNNGGNIFISREHSLLNVLKDAQITIKTDEIRRLSHIVVRSLGGKSNSYSPEIVRLQRAEYFSGIICSDGIFQFYSNEDLAAALSKKSYQDFYTEFNLPSFPDALDNVSGLLFFSK